MSKTLSLSNSSKPVEDPQGTAQHLNIFAKSLKNLN